MINKEDLLNKVTQFYLTSYDFNGIPSYHLPEFVLSDLEELITEGKVFILSESGVNNIHINGYNSFDSVSKQLDAIHSGLKYAIYPSSKHLETINIQEEKPFTRMLMLGAEQFRILYFCVDVLEIYANNPQYTFQDYGYVGNICVNSSADENDPIHSEYIKDYGVAYPRTGPQAPQRILCKRFSTKSRISRFQCAG